MGRYEVIFQSDAEISEELTPEEAGVAICLMTMYADGEPSEEEIELLSSYLEGAELIEKAELDAVIEKVNGIAQQEGPGALFNAAVAATPEELVPDIYQLALYIAAGDGTITEDEAEYAELLGEALGLSEEEMQAIIDEVFAEEEEDEEEE